MIFEDDTEVKYKFISKDKLIELLQSICDEDVYLSCSDTRNIVICKHYPQQKVEYIGYIDLLIDELQ